eukprot:767887-Hanusia_phi.AAC.3
MSGDDHNARYAEGTASASMGSSDHKARYVRGSYKDPPYGRISWEVLQQLLRLPQTRNDFYA